MKINKKIISIILGIGLMLMTTGCGTSKQIDLVINKINDIGDVTYDSKQSIEEAENMYNDLSEKQQESVTNKDILFKAIEKYENINTFFSVGKKENNGYTCIVSSDKLSIEVDTNPHDLKRFSDKDAVTTIKNINKTLDFPDSLYMKMISTRALDGRQSENSKYFTVSWTYHPNKGLRVLYELNN